MESYKGKSQGATESLVVVDPHPKSLNGLQVWMLLKIYYQLLTELGDCPCDSKCPGAMVGTHPSPHNPVESEKKGGILNT